MAAKPWWRETIETVLWALVLALILRYFVVQAFWIPSGSMIPTLIPGDRVLVSKFWYHFQPPKRGQIIVFKYPLDPKRDFIKRVIGLPGEVVSMEEGVVYIDGEPLAEPYVKIMIPTIWSRLKSQKNPILLWETTGRILRIAVFGVCP